MDKSSILLEIGDLLGYFDINGADAMDSSQVEALENYIEICNNSSSSGEELVVNAIYDRMVDVLKILNPDSKLLREVWGEDVASTEEMQDLLHRDLNLSPMCSIQTCKSYECSEIMTFVNKLPDEELDMHGSAKLNGHGIRLVYVYGYLEGAFSRARHTSGRDLTRQMQLIAERDGYLNIEAFSEIESVSIRGELLLPLSNLSQAREFNSTIVSALSGVASMSRDSASDDEVLLLDFVAYKVVGEGFYFPTKTSMYSALNSYGFKTPISWTIPSMHKSTLLQELPEIITECEDAILGNDGGEAYDFFTDGIVWEVDNTDLFASLGSDGGKYNYGNIALKVGYWQQDLYMGYIQTILWTHGKNKLSPVAIIASDIDVALFNSDSDEAPPYIKDLKEIRNYSELGVVTAGGNRVRRVPLFEPSNMILLDAYVGSPLFFRYGGESGVLPCTIDGTTLASAKIKEQFSGNDDDELYQEYNILE